MIPSNEIISQEPVRKEKIKTRKELPKECTFRRPSFSTLFLYLQKFNQEKKGISQNKKGSCRG